MSLAEISLGAAVKRQFLFKLKANIDVYSSLMIMQLLAFAISYGDRIRYAVRDEIFLSKVYYYSVDPVIGITIFWGLVTGITVLTKGYTDTDFTFVTNRLSSTLSNILFLAAVGLAGAITAMLSKNVILLVALFVDKADVLYGSPMTAGDFFLGTAVVFLYVSLACAIGYFIGALVKLNKIFVFLIPALLIGSLMFDTAQDQWPLLFKVYEFYFHEFSTAIFVVKVLASIILCYLVSFLILNRMEIRS